MSMWKFRFLAANSFYFVVILIIIAFDDVCDEFGIITDGLDTVIKVGHNCRMRQSNPCKSKRCFDSCTVKGYQCIAYKGADCHDIRKKYPSIVMLNRRYSITFGTSIWSSIFTFCDMNTDGGGWIRIGHVEIETLSNATDIITDDLNALSKGRNFILSPAALQELNRRINFKQIRFYCRKKRVNRVVHVMTAKNVLGYIVVKYFSNDSMLQPHACGSYIRLPDDTSHISKRCNDWGMRIRNRWGSMSLDDQPITIAGELHMAFINGRCECDDFDEQEVKDPRGVWSYYVR